MIAISIITPVYKAEKYLYKCVDSILSQTFKNFELILVDDGSPDSSGLICDNYAVKDTRVKVIHKSNGGVASARQMGIDVAQGEYSIHADPDDWVEPTMLEELYQKAKEENADMVICDYYVNNSREQIYVKQQPTSLESQQVIRDLFQKLHGSLCNKLIKSVCYKEHNINFVIGIDFCEDVLLLTKILLNPIKISYLSKAFYHYDQNVNNNSITRKINKNLIDNEVRYIFEISKVLPLNTFDMVLLRMKANIKSSAIIHQTLNKDDYKKIFPEVDFKVDEVVGIPKWHIVILKLAREKHWILLFLYRKAHLMGTDLKRRIKLKRIKQ